jgi:cell wall-associated NlpC family hydrolase
MRLILVITGLLFALMAQAAPRTDFDEEAAVEPQAGQNLKGQLHQVGQTVADRASSLVVTALGFLGVPYHRGGSTAETGFDCSGFVRATYNQTIGYLLPRRAEDQAAATQKIDRSELQPGDLVFFNTMRRTFSHVGIYIGEGKFIHAPRTGANVRVESMSVKYWQRRFSGARRVVAAQGDDAVAGP